jgi:ankyrin repeat protein
LKALLGNGVNTNLGDLNGRTPLMYAAAIGSAEAAISLIEGGANPWLTDKLYAR